MNLVKSIYRHNTASSGGGLNQLFSWDIYTPRIEVELGVTQLNAQSPVARRFIAVGHNFQRPMNRATTAGAPSRIPTEVRNSYPYKFLLPDIQKIVPADIASSGITKYTSEKR